jgi:ADP-ribosylglycohydrolase
MHSLPSDYLERVYAGVLGKVIGVYLGRPFEGWSYERIMAELGEIEYYVHDHLKVPLIVTDDDITGTFTFIRALDDHPGGYDLSSAQIGQTWLNYIIENQSILWWGGLGNSSEHTAFLRLKQGIPAPRSGSMALNGPVVAEQIGAQIFIDGWGMVCPGDPEKAAALAAQAGRVSHDGEAVLAAQVVAAIEAQAFVESDLNRLLDTACGLIPASSLIYRLIGDLREWHAQYPDWRQARARIAERYGYDRFPGNCHVVPNHALIHLGLLYGDHNFQKALMITNTSGWDTDCNSANVGCIMGIRGGLAGIDAGPDWRGPVADRIYLPTADGGRAISDCVRESLFIANLGRKLAGQAPFQPKNGARFHFDLPGALQGFVVEESHSTTGTLTIRNVSGHSTTGSHSLELAYRHLTPGRCARTVTATFAPPEAIDMPGYALTACPTLYPGQTIRASLAADLANHGSVRARLFLTVYAGQELVRHFGPRVIFAPGAAHSLKWTLSERSLSPIAQIGIEIDSESFAEGSLYLDSLTWDGEPDLSLVRPAGNAKRWQQAWVAAVDGFRNGPPPGGFGIIQNHARGLLIQGTRDWQNYRVSATICPHLISAGGIAARVQGLRRYYALLLKNPGKVCLVKFFDGLESELGAASLDWKLEGEYALSLEVQSNHLRGWVENNLLFDLPDDHRPLLDGAIALVCEEGYLSTYGIELSPIR